MIEDTKRNPLDVTKMLVLTALVAAIYSVLTVALGAISYGPIQVRISTALYLLAIYNPAFIPGLVLGNFISNLFSPLNVVVDVILGTFTGYAVCMCISKFSTIKGKPLLSLIIAAIQGSIIIAITVSIIITISFEIPWETIPMAIMAGQIFAGSMIAMGVVGVPLFTLLMRNSKISSFIESAGRKVD